MLAHSLYQANTKGQVDQQPALGSWHRKTPQRFGLFPVTQADLQPLTGQILQIFGTVQACRTAQAKDIKKGFANRILALQQMRQGAAKAEDAPLRAQANMHRHQLRQACGA